MIAPNDFEDQVITIKEALSGFPDLLTRFDNFVGKIKNKDDLLFWIKNIKFKNNLKKDEATLFVLTLKQSMFVCNVMNYNCESFDVFCSAVVNPLLAQQRYKEAVIQVWLEFTKIFETAWMRRNKNWANYYANM